MKTLYFVASTATPLNDGYAGQRRLSRPVSRVSTLRRILKRVRRTNPNAYAMQHKFYR